jgi:protein gp37
MFREYPRLKRFGLPTYQWSPDEIHIHEQMLEKPLSWKHPKMIFTNSMSDFFHEKIPFEFLDRVFEIITHQRFRFRLWCARLQAANIAFGCGDCSKPK